MNALLSPPLAATAFAAGPRVLFVDDSELLRLLVSLMLREHGYDVETADNGFEGWRRTADNLHAKDSSPGRLIETISHLVGSLPDSNAGRTPTFFALDPPGERGPSLS